MKKNLLIIIHLLVCANVFAGNDRNLKLMTFNLRFGELASMQDFADAINSESPDIVALQECDWATYRERAPRQHGVKFLNELAYRTGMFGLYGKAIDYRQGFYGVSILSKYPIVRSERIFLPHEPGTEQRILLVADIELPDGEIITFACTHLEVSSSECRLQQAKFIQKKLKDRKTCFLAGDMNAASESPEMVYLGRYWKNLTPDILTHSVKNLSRHLDYIFAKPAKKVELISTGIMPDVKLSDHYPVVSEIVLKGSK